MVPSGIVFAASVAAGVLAASTVLPLGPRAAALIALGTAAAAAGNRRAAFLVPLGLGLFRAADTDARYAALAVRAPLRIEGACTVIAPQGGGCVVRAGRRRLLVSEPPPGLPPPGNAFAAVLRADPVRSRAEPSAFRADRWARALRIHGRATVLTEPRDVRAAPGPTAALRRAADAFRTAARRRLGGGEDAPSGLVIALLLGDRRGLEDDDRQAFRRAGLAHVLALSGMHAGVLALGVGALLRAAAVRGPALGVSVTVFLAAFAFVTGARPPILRACGTGGLAALGTALGRRTGALHALGVVGGVLLLTEPAVLGDAGFRLSFTAAGVLSLAASSPRPAPVGAVRRLRAALLLSSLVTLATLPAIAAAFGVVSLLSPVTNLFAGPPAAAALGWGGLAALLPGPDAITERLAGAAALAARGLLLLSRLAARLPGGEVPLPAPGPLLAACAVGAAGLAAAGRRPGPAARRGLGVLLAAAALGSLPRDRLCVVDVGQGNAVLIEERRGAVLVDGGLPGREGPSAALAALRYRGRTRLAAAIATHGDADHAGGIADLLRPDSVDTLFVPPRDEDPPPLLAALVARAASAGTPVVALSGAPRRLLRGRVTVRSPWPRGRAPHGSAENDLSLVTRWRAGRIGALLTGDLGTAGEEALLAGSPRGALAAEVLLAGHHGSRTSTGTALLDAVLPRLVIVSCGARNPYGHPAPETLARVRAHGAALLRTDRDGTITLTPTRRGLRIRWVRGFPGPRRPFPGIPLSRSVRFP
jgi:competence protein ComEC